MRLLIIGTYDNEVSAASRIAQNKGATVSHCTNVESAVTSLCSGKGADLIMIDVMLDIKKLIDELNQSRISIDVVAFGLNAKSEDAAKAIKAGAKEYIPLPPDEKLIAAVLEAIAQDNVASSTLVFKSPQMDKIMKLASQVAPSDANILITGESGTGKELMARFIHSNSKRKTAPFITVNCAAIPEQLIESELFGHEKGAFTGAMSQRIGKFEESNNGTLLLDEISEMDVRLQAKLLRAIQEKEIDRVGGSKPVKINLRVIATSNRDLKEEVKKGSFREDLYFRLNIINIHLPPLRERKEDIGIFASYFIKKYAENNGVAPLPMSEKSIEMLKAYHWPGNVRELENTMHRSVLLAQGPEIDEGAIMLSVDMDNGARGSASAGGSSIVADNANAPAVTETGESAAGNTDNANLVGRTVSSVERDLILNTLTHCLGNRTHAANILGISIRTLRNKLKEYENVA